jgi:hypothetical protein
MQGTTSCVDQNELKSLFRAGIARAERIHDILMSRLPRIAGTGAKGLADRRLVVDAFRVCSFK